MNIRHLRLLNKKLPRPDQKVRGNSRCLHITTEMGFRIDIDDSLQNYFEDLNSNRLMIDDQSIVFGIDSTLNHQSLQTADFIIGDGIANKKIHNHLSTPWSRYFWITEFPKSVPYLKDRNGWCCTMHRKRPHRDVIANVLIKRQKFFFGHANYFCYDFADHNLSSLEMYMFKRPFYDKEHNLRGDMRHKNFIKNNDAIKTDYLIEALLGPWHYENLIEIVPESSCDIFFLTEKTIKPIAAGMPFVMVSSYKFLYHLRKFGFKTFHPFIDESYDVEPDLQKRITMVMKSAEKFINHNQNLDELQKICDHNRQVLARILKHTYSSRIWKKLRRFITVDTLPFDVKI